MDNRNIKKEASAIVRVLKEKKKHPFIQIQNLIEHKGIDFVRDYVDKTLQIETEGGMMTHDGDRRRTTGGVFFYLVKADLTPEERAIVFPVNWKRQRAKHKARQQARKAEEQTKAQAVVPDSIEPQATGQAEPSRTDDKLAQLEDAARKLRERIKQMETKGQKGIKMTKSLLEQTERQIEKLRM